MQTKCNILISEIKRADLQYTS